MVTEEEAIDINNPLDFTIAEAILNSSGSQPWNLIGLSAEMKIGYDTFAIYSKWHKAEPTLYVGSSNL